MAEFQVGVWSTQALYDECVTKYGSFQGFRARNRAVDWIQGAFNQIGHTVDLVYGTDTPDPPTEDISGSRCADCICGSGTCCYDNQLDWWLNYYDSSCHSLSNANHARILLCKGGGGGLGGGKYAAVGTGTEIARLSSSYEKFGYDDTSHKGMRVCLHELGHCLIDSRLIADFDQDSFDGEHDEGVIRKDPDNGKYAVSPMGLKGDQNNCKSNQYDKSLKEGWSLWWSDCAVNDFKDA